MSYATVAIIKGKSPASLEVEVENNYPTCRDMNLIGADVIGSEDSHKTSHLITRANSTVYREFPRWWDNLDTMITRGYHLVRYLSSFDLNVFRSSDKTTSSGRLFQSLMSLRAKECFLILVLNR